MLNTVNLQVEYKTNPIGMDEVRPRFSYQLTGDSAAQSARRIRVTCECGKVFWDSDWVECSSSIQIEYEGLFLKPFRKYFWQVRVRDEKGVESDWTDGKAFFETGFFGGAWQAKWIAAKQGVENMQSVSRFRKDFTPKGKISRARLYATALGVYRAFLNGDAVSDDCLTPGSLDFYHRTQYQAYDVTERITTGNNALCFELGDGWYSGRIARHWRGGAPTYGEFPKLLAELHIDYADGTSEILVTDKNFQMIDGDNSGVNTIRMSDIYMGETFWSHSDGYNWRQPDKPMRFNRDSGEVSVPASLRIDWQAGAPIRHIMDKAPVSISQRKNGNWIVDFGQNLTGRERIHLKDVEAGTCIVIRHGEMLTAEGNLYTDNLRTASATTTYICLAGKAEEDYEPTFTFYGFRYLEISGWPGELTRDQLVARVLHSDLPVTGDFSCSEPIINQLFSNIVWGQRSNFVDVPTDCPQRDERYGWTGDTQVFTNVATYNMYAPEFYTKWIEDLNSCRSPNGAYPHFAPNAYQSDGDNGCTGWGDAGVICPWILFRKYADTRILRKYYSNICVWLDFQIKKANGSLIVKNACFGDWLNIDAPTPENLISTAYLAGMNRIASQMASILGQKDEAEKRMRMHRDIAAAFAEEFFTPDGELKVKTQTAALLALAFGTVPEQFIAKTVSFLVTDIRDTKKLHLSTGFLGTPLLLGVLTEHGEIDLAYDLLCQTTYPGWLYPVTQGATTMWERWNSYTKDKGFGDVGMNSFNHYAYGAVGEWFYETVCGIRDIDDSACTAGFKKFLLAPQPGKKFAHASASYLSAYGEIKSAWKRSEKEFVWNFTVPCNTTAQVVCPFGKELPETEGIEVKNGVAFARPGSYTITLPL